MSPRADRWLDQLLSVTVMGLLVSGLIATFVLVAFLHVGMIGMLPAVPFIVAGGVVLGDVLSRY